MIIDLRCACREPLMRFLAPPFDVGAEFGLAVSLLEKGSPPVESGPCVFDKTHRLSSHPAWHASCRLFAAAVCSGVWV